jgi:hypothetical protein
MAVALATTLLTLGARRISTPLLLLPHAVVGQLAVKLCLADL